MLKISALSAGVASSVALDFIVIAGSAAVPGGISVCSVDHVISPVVGLSYRMLADPVRKYLRECKEMTVATGVAADNAVETKPAKRSMRVHDLLRHSAELTYGFFGKGVARTALNDIDDGFSKSRRMT